jgi:competence protein ComEC
MRLKIFQVLLLLANILVLVGCGFTQQAPDLKLTFIDVGEGDSTLITTSKGSAILIDAGPVHTSRNIFEILRQEKVEKISYLLITHPDLDHFSGGFAILDHFEVACILDNGQNIQDQAASNDVYRWYEERFRSWPCYQQLRSDDKIVLDDIELKVLWPPAGSLDSNWNNNSLILALEYQGVKILLMADALKETELALLPALLDFTNVDILKAGHHGSKFTLSNDFLAVTRPRNTIISVNKNNLRSYPSQRVVDDYKQYGKVYRSDHSGSVQIHVYSQENFKIVNLKDNE